MSFEIIFITEQAGSVPATEIQYGGQRLCVIRLPAEAPEIEFVQDLYVAQAVEMTFGLDEFMETLRLATDDLRSWMANLESQESS